MKRSLESRPILAEDWHFSIDKVAVEDILYGWMGISLESRQSLADKYEHAKRYRIILFFQNQQKHEDTGTVISFQPFKEAQRE